MNNNRYNRKLMKLAIAYGCQTAKEFSIFVKKYSAHFEVSQSGRGMIQPSLFTCC